MDDGDDKRVVGERVVRGGSSSVGAIEKSAPKLCGAPDEKAGTSSIVTSSEDMNANRITSRGSTGGGSLIAPQSPRRRLK